MNEFQAIILAAGKGTRMKSEQAKVLHDVVGKPMIGHVVDAALAAGATRVVAVLGHQIEDVTAWLKVRYGNTVKVARQDEQRGTGHAIWSARQWLQEDAPPCTLILSGDVPNLSSNSISDFVERSSDSTMGLITATLSDPARYGRIVRNASNEVARIVEYKDATPNELQINEVNAGIYLVRSDFLLAALKTLCDSPPDNEAGEYYLTDVVEMAAQTGSVFPFAIADAAEVSGVNTRVDLAKAEAYARLRINTHWMESGVTLKDPENTYIGADALLEFDVTLHPGVMVDGRSVVGSGTVIESGCVIRDSTIGKHTHIKPHSVITDSTVGDSTDIGPFAHIRPDSHVGNHCKVGNFVEIKKTTLQDGAKASHLTYLGDAVVGEKANIGAGTITCNYDGKSKHQTVIGQGAFIGSNSALVAPVTIGDGAYIGAGSVITSDVPAGALGVARGRQQNIENWARRRRAAERT